MIPIIVPTYAAILVLMFVLTIIGQRTETPIPSLLSSRRSDSVMPTTANLLAQ